MATEYIKREDALDAWCEKERYTDIEAIPAADVVERKRGEWKWISSTYDQTPCKMEFWCTKCHHRVITHGQSPWEHFCPNCGAQMDGDSDV